MPRKSKDEKFISATERRRRRMSKKVQGPAAEKLLQGLGNTYETKPEDQSSYERGGKGTLKDKSKTKVYHVGKRKAGKRITETPIYRDSELAIKRTDSKQDIAGGKYKQGETKKLYTGTEEGYEGKYKKDVRPEFVGKTTTEKTLGASKDAAKRVKEMEADPDYKEKVKRKSKIEREKGYASKGKTVRKRKYYGPKPVYGKRTVERDSKVLGKDDRYIRTQTTKTITKGDKEKEISKTKRTKNPDVMSVRERRNAAAKASKAANPAYYNSKQAKARKKKR